MDEWVTAVLRVVCRVVGFCVPFVAFQINCVLCSKLGYNSHQPTGILLHSNIGQKNVVTITI
jgi:hypothetical protein